MDETSKIDAAARNQSLIMAKVLLQKFNILHDFHVQQMRRYTVACCTPALGGEFAINPEERLVSYEIKTDYRFKRIKGGRIIPRHPLSIVLLWKKLDSRVYAHHKRMALNSLNAWTKELLWGEGTRVRVTIDGQSVDE